METERWMEGVQKMKPPLPYRYDVMFYSLGSFCPEEGDSTFRRNTSTKICGITSQKTVILTPFYGYVIFLAPH